MHVVSITISKNVFGFGEMKERKKMKLKQI